MKAIFILFVLGLVSLAVGWQIVKIAGSLILGALGIVFAIVASVIGLIAGLLGAFFGAGILGIFAPALLVMLVILGVIALFKIL